MKSLVVRAEVIGQRGTSFEPLRLEERSFPFQTARDLLCGVVEQQVDEYRLRKQEAQLLRILSAEAIEDGRSTGKIVSGGQDQAHVPAVPDAIRAAIQAFEDGLFYMFVNDVQVEILDQPIGDQENMDLLFLRLTPLVGG